MNRIPENAKEQVLTYIQKGHAVQGEVLFYIYIYSLDLLHNIKGMAEEMEEIHPIQGEKRRTEDKQHQARAERLSPREEGEYRGPPDGGNTKEGPPTRKHTKQGANAGREELFPYEQPGERAKLPSETGSGREGIQDHRE